MYVEPGPVTNATFTIEGKSGPMQAYVARPGWGHPRPAVIVLEGIYGFDAELRRITDLVAAANYVGLAIDYLRGRGVPQGFDSQRLPDDLAAARDWLNEQSYVKHGEIATWGFGVGGSAAFASAMLPGIEAAVAFYGQQIVKTLPDGAKAPLVHAQQIRAPLLLIFGGADELVTAEEIHQIEAVLDGAGKRYDVEIYPNVGHSFFRQDLGTIANREIADAWDRVQAFLRRVFS